MGSIKLGTQELDDRPMNLHETVVFLFLIEPYVPAMLQAITESALDMLKALLEAIRDRDPDDLPRLLAMLYHSDAEAFFDETIKPDELSIAVLAGLQANQFPHLIRAGIRLGII